MITANNGAINKVREYVRMYPKMKDYTLAKKIYTEYPQLFSSFESARYRIRYVRGHAGNERRKEASKELQTPLNFDTRNSFDGFESSAPKLKTFKLPIGIKNILFLSDIHLPYQDNDALLTALNYGVAQNVDCIWLNGDIMDMYQASAHEKLPSKDDLRYEIDFTKDFFQRLRTIFPTQTIYFKEGNHEVRWRRMLMRKAPEIIGIAEFDLQFVLELEKYKVFWIPNSTLVKFGKLSVIHGNEFMGAGGKHPATNLYNKAKVDIIAGDKHRTDNSVTTDLNKGVTKVYAVGCLCDLNPEYYLMGHTAWNHGFAHIKMNGDKFIVHNYRIGGDGEIY
jgi:predicted phosphodiesterase